MMRGEIPSSRRYQSLTRRRMAKNPHLERKIAQMTLPLAPLVQINTGDVHPAFPRTVLHFWLLTDGDLEALAAFYHQRTPCVLTAQYPCPVVWRSDLPLEEKRRRMGKFIGLRGCETPVLLKTEEQIQREASRAAEEEEQWKRKMYPWS